MTKLKPVLLLLLLLVLQSSWALPSKGCIAIFHESQPISIEVTLPEFSGGTLQTKQLQFNNMPANMVPDQKGRYCYPMDDPRFAFVHTFYYAVKQIEDYNQIFGKLGIPLTKTLSWHVLKSTGPSTGTSDGGVTYHSTAPDPTLIQHEIGHWVQANALGTNDCPDCDIDGLSEGSANLLAALHSGDSIISRYDGEATAYDINLFIRFPDYISTYREIFEKIAEDPKTNAKYPDTVKNVKDTLELGKTDADIEKWLNSENPYITSDAINQPLWLAAMSNGSEKIKLIYVKSLAMLNQKRPYTYSEVANTIIDNARELDPALSDYLKQSYTMRGIFTSNFYAKTYKKSKKDLISHIILK